MPTTQTIDEFIARFPKGTQKLLTLLRKTIHKTAPEAKETIKYGIPTFTLEGNLVHFSAYPKHIGFYPGDTGIEAFKKELSDYPTSKGTVQFPLDKPLPLDLIIKIVQFRIHENHKKSASKK